MQQPQAQLSSILTVLEVAHPGPEDALQITRELIEALPVPIFYKSRDGRYKFHDLRTEALATLLDRWVKHSRGKNP